VSCEFRVKAILDFRFAIFDLRLEAGAEFAAPFNRKSKIKNLKSVNSKPETRNSKLDFVTWFVSGG